MYQGDAPPWDIGHPQPAIVRLAARGGFAGTVLDAGCGTGENALHIAAMGLPVMGIELVEAAVVSARKKALERGIEAQFVAGDASHLELLGRTFDTVMDCGLFHTLEGDEQTEYAASLATVTRHGGTLHVLCFSDEGPDTGPHPIRQDELRAAFSAAAGWDVVAIVPERIEATIFNGGAPAWLATVRRV